MTYTKYLILEWVGRWIIPDHAHGGAHPGPFDLQGDAQKEIDRIADHEFRAMLRHPLSEAPPTDEDKRLAACHRNYVVNRHKVIEVRGWPEDLQADPWDQAFPKAVES